jgi:hypothetical protein
MKEETKKQGHAKKLEIDVKSIPARKWSAQEEARWASYKAKHQK